MFVSHALEVDHYTVNDRIQLLMQLRTQGIRDTRVLSAIEATSREQFVDPNFHAHAYEDTALPIASGQTISQPTVVGFMTQALGILPTHTVLEIGTGSGYQAAILSKLARRVYSVERIRELYLTAQSRFDEQRLNNIVTRYGDGSKGWPEAAPFDRIMLTAATDTLTCELLEQLRPGGIMIAPVSEMGKQNLVKVVRDMHGEYHVEKQLPVRFVPLLNGIK